MTASVHTETQEIGPMIASLAPEVHERHGSPAFWAASGEGGKPHRL